VSPAERALAVMVLTPHIRAYLTEKDPKALEQAIAALPASVGRVCCPVFRVFWESERGEEGSCMLEEFIEQNADSLADGQLPVDPDAPPDSLTLEAFTLGMWAVSSANDPLGFGAGPAPEDIEFSWDAWLALSHEERQELRREAWRLMRQVPGMPLVPTRAIGKPLPGFEAPEP